MVVMLDGAVVVMMRLMMRLMVLLRRPVPKKMNSKGTGQSLGPTKVKTTQISAAVAATAQMDSFRRAFPLT